MQKVIIGREYPEVITPLIEQCQHSLDILVFDWRWYANEPNSTIQKLNLAIVDANRRGVKVRALVNNNIMPTILHLQGLQVRRVGTKSMMHIKLLIFDNQKMVIGSHNLSKNAFLFNHEISMLTDDLTEIARCKNYFEMLCHL